MLTRYKTVVFYKFKHSTPPMPVLTFLVTCVMSFLILLLSSDTIQEIYIRMNLIKQSSPPMLAPFLILERHDRRQSFFSLFYFQSRRPREV